MIWAFAKKSGFPREGGWAKAQWCTLHPSQGSLPWHNVMSNLAITADSLFPQMSWWPGTWASMHMHTLSPGTAHFVRRQHLYKHNKRLMHELGDFACVRHHGNMYVFLHSKLTGPVCLMEQLQPQATDWCVYYTSTQHKRKSGGGGDIHWGLPVFSLLSEQPKTPPNCMSHNKYLMSSILKWTHKSGVDILSSSYFSQTAE